jgi:hypothetical protein
VTFAKTQAKSKRKLSFQRTLGSSEKPSCELDGGFDYPLHEILHKLNGTGNRATANLDCKVSDEGKKILQGSSKIQKRIPKMVMTQRIGERMM